jgi:hypothetical protein
VDPESKEVRTFVAKVEAALAPGFGEVLTEETRKVQKALLILSFVILLIAFDAIQFSGDIEFIGLKFAGTKSRQTTLILGLVVCAYLEVLVAARCYAELGLWQLRRRVGQLDTMQMEEELKTLHRAIGEDIMAARTVARRGEVEVELPTFTGRIRVPRTLLRDLPIFSRVLAAMIGRRFARAGTKVAVSRETAKRLERMKRFDPHTLQFVRDSAAYENSRKARVSIEILFPLIFGLATVAYGCYIAVRAALYLPNEGS